MIRKVFEIINEDGFKGLIARTHAWLKRRFQSYLQELQARRRGSYRNGDALQLQSRLHRSALSRILEQQCIPTEVAEHYLAHRFDLLGSGWTQVQYGLNCLGLEGYRYAMGDPVTPDSGAAWLQGRINPSNLQRAQSIWRLVDVEYQPIDWQLDFKSGFRWSEKVWAKRLVYGVRLGVDVKVPWELARMQHLPQLALRAIALHSDQAEGCRLAREVRNQILDFIATNPPGFGANWLCPMDAAIRAANWLLAWDLLHVADYAFETDVEDIFANSIYDHGVYITKNLEWSPLRGNHFLSEICGLAFIAAYLPETDVTNTWLAFAIQQLNDEVRRQFHPDGGNFEGSTAYHRLSSEMVLYATALILGLPEWRLKAVACADLHSLNLLSARAHSNTAARVALHLNTLIPQGDIVETVFDPAYVCRLAAFTDFFAYILKSGGTFPQTGDNDSGRFFKFRPEYSRGSVGQMKRIYANLEGYSALPDTAHYFLEQHLNGLHLLDAATGIGWRTPSTLQEDQVACGTSGIDAAVVRALSHGRELAGLAERRGLYKPNLACGHDEKLRLYEIWDQVKALSGLQLKTYRFPANINRGSNRWDIKAFPDFGCYIFKYPLIYIAIRCISGQIGNSTSHFHEDQLSLELEINGQTMFADPGTFVYTPLPSARNQYRSQKAHFAPGRKEDQGITQNDNVFGPLRIQPATVKYLGSEGFAAEVIYANYLVGLFLKFETDGIEVTHYCNGGGTLSTLDQSIPFSPGYGIKIRDTI